MPPADAELKLVLGSAGASPSRIFHSQTGIKANRRMNATISGQREQRNQRERDKLAWVLGGRTCTLARRYWGG